MEISTKRYPALPRSERRRLGLASSAGTIKATYTTSGAQSYWQLADNSALATDRDVYTTGNIAAFGAPDTANVGAINQQALDNAIASALTDYAKADHTHPGQALQAHHHTIGEVDDLTASLAAKLNTADVGYSRTNAAAKFVAFPTLAFLNQQGYTNGIVSGNNTEYFKGILRWLKDTQPLDSYACYIGIANPDSIGTLIVNMTSNANTTGPDTTLPLYASGLFVSYSNIYPFYVVGGVFYLTNKWNGTATSSDIANRLTYARTIWGQSFNGTANVSGAMTGVTNITASGNISGKNVYATTMGATDANFDRMEVRDKVILAQGVYLWYDEANDCVRCNKPIVSTGNITAFNT